MNYFPKNLKSKHHSGVRKYPIVELKRRFRKLVTMYITWIYSLEPIQLFSNIPSTLQEPAGFLSLSLLASRNCHLRGNKDNERNRVAQSWTEHGKWINRT